MFRRTSGISLEKLVDAAVFPALLGTDSIPVADIAHGPLSADCVEKVGGLNMRLIFGNDHAAIDSLRA